MPVTFFVEPSRLPSWSPWSEWLESGARREPRCLWLRRPALKRGPELPLQLQGPGGKRVCCRPAAESDDYRQVVDVAGYRPDEVRVRLSADGQVTVSACHRERSDTGFSHSRMVRRLSLPQHVRADQLSSRWTSAGQLVLEAPAAEPSERCGRCPRDQRKVIVVPVTYDTPAVKEGQDKTAEEGGGDRQEVAVRSGSPASECGQSSVLASVDVSSFLPEEVEVRVSGRHLAIEAVHEERAGDGGSCQLRLARRLPLPTHVDPDLVTCRLTRAGQLLLEAPVTPAPGA
ncbi:Protein lethal(2)essential for life [Amphibalanus amphitrite]|uniref:Protein lethal(2)essential for life n=1 Tax=Amphibalanus amphitrite TaxID=1232801 RepID=A0A6A4VF55_AMPAM|nr:Protein lethal(2)essential for life [Amphibalanus amphitrite]